jgi:hypothetical protein
MEVFNMLPYSTKQGTKGQKSSIIKANNSKKKQKMEILAQNTVLPNIVTQPVLNTGSSLPSPYSSPSHSKEILVFIGAVVLVLIIFWLVFKLLKKFQIPPWFKGMVLGLLIIPISLFSIVFSLFGTSTVLFIPLSVVGLPIWLASFIIKPYLLAGGDLIPNPTLLGWVISFLFYGLAGALIGFLVNRKRQ